MAPKESVQQVLPLRENTPALYVCKSIPGKGQGLVASASIPAGTRILAESPLITVPRDTNDKESIRKSIRAQLLALPENQRRAYLTLSNAYGTEEGDELGIARTNALPLGSNAKEGAVFPDASRINHACNCNAQNTWNERTQKLTVYAARDITPEEEITIYYLNRNANRSSRQFELSTKFRFVCRCDLCSLEEKDRLDSDRRLDSIQRLDDRIGVPERIISSPLDVLHDVRNLLSLLKEEGITGSDVARAYYDGFQAAVMHSDLARASELAGRSASARAVVEGHDSPQVQRLEALAANPTKHHSWGLTKTWETEVGADPRELTAGEYEEWLWRRKLLPPPKLADLRNDGAFLTFDDLPTDNDIDLDFFETTDGYYYGPSKHWCFLAEIVDVERFLRLRLDVKDRAGQINRLMFYTDDRGEEVPRSLVRPGNTVAVLYAEHHGFLDMSVGVRHEEPQFLKIFPVQLTELLELSDRVQKHISMGEKGITCHSCGESSETLKKCARCSIFWYCGKDCQTIGWTQKGHKNDCKLLKDSGLQGLLRLEWGNFEEHHKFN